MDAIGGDSISVKLGGLICGVLVWGFGLRRFVVTNWWGFHISIELGGLVWRFDSVCDGLLSQKEIPYDLFCCARVYIIVQRD